MTREMIKLASERQKEAEMLVRYANPKSRKRPTLKWVIEKLSRHIPYCREKPIVKSVTVKDYNRNKIIKTARFKVETEDGKIWEISVYKDLKGRSQFEKEQDKISSFPSRLFCIFHEEIKD